MNSKHKGDITEAAVLARLIRLGIPVLMPFGDNRRYDMVIEEGGVFRKIQCKTGRVRNGRLVFNTCSSQWHRSKGKQSYLGHVDYFAVYEPESEQCYLVPVAEVPRDTAYLRLEPTQNGQNKGVRWAHNYQL